MILQARDQSPAFPGAGTRRERSRDGRAVIVHVIMRALPPCAARGVRPVQEREPDAEPGRGRLGSAY
jgi:hypothetical protein